jgi:hypothetical protein
MNLLNLLRTSEASNWELAFQLLQGGGMPDDDFLLTWAKIMLKIRKSQRGFYLCLKYNYLALLKDRRRADLSELNLSEIPENLFKLEGLRKIDLSHNQIKHLPDQFKALPNLKSLNFDHNLLDALPTSLYHIENLEYLDLSYNPIEVLSPQIQNLKKLKSLWMIDTLISQEHLAEVQSWLPETYIYDDFPF